MSKAAYDRLIQEFCESLGLERADPADKEMHLEVSGSLVGMVYDEDVTRDTICVYFDLGFAPDGEFHKHMLKDNICVGSRERGYFALHPMKESVVYCAKVLLSHDLTSQVLSEKLQAGLAEARRSFQYLGTSNSEVSFPAAALA